MRMITVVVFVEMLARRRRTGRGEPKATSRCFCLMRRRRRRRTRRMMGGGERKAANYCLCFFREP